MSEEPADSANAPELTDEVELILDGGNLLVVGSSKRAVETYMRSAGFLEGAREITSRQLVPMLRSAAETTRTIADTVAESGLWITRRPSLREHP